MTETERPNYESELKVLENAVFAASIEGDERRGAYSIEAMKEFYKKTVKYFEEDKILQEALSRAESHYEQGGKGSGSASVSNTMKMLAGKYQEVLITKMSLSEAYSYLIDGEEPDEETKKLLDKYAGKKLPDIDDKLDRAKITNIFGALMQYRTDKLIPKFGKNVRNSRIEKTNKASLENLVDREE